MAHLAALKAANADLAQAANKDSDFMHSSYGKAYQKQLDAYNEKKSAFLKSRGWSEDSLSQASGETKQKKYYDGAGRNAHDRGPRYKSISVSRQEVVNREVGAAPSAANYLKDWKNAGKPSYREPTDAPVNRETSDNAPSSGTATSDSSGSDSSGSDYGRFDKYHLAGSDQPAQKGYRRQTASDASDTSDTAESGSGSSDEGIGGRREPLAKRYKPLGG